METKMSSHETNQRKKNRKDKKRDRVEDIGFKRGSGVNYSQVSDRHIDDSRYERQKPTAVSLHEPSNESKSGDGVGSQKVSSQMEAVMRIMLGKEERTISEKLADSNRPTWEQYKKDNEDKLDLIGEDQKKMEEYRRELDRDRERKLQRGRNHIKHSKDKKRSKSSRKKKRRKHGSSRYDYDSNSESSSNSESEVDDKSSNEESNEKKSSKQYRDKSRKRRHKKRHKKSSRKTKKKSNESDDDDAYRLSSFFAKNEDSGTDSDSNQDR